MLNTHRHTHRKDALGLCSTLERDVNRPLAPGPDDGVKQHQRQDGGGKLRPAPPRWEETSWKTLTGDMEGEEEEEEKKRTVVWGWVGGGGGVSGPGLG